MNVTAFTCPSCDREIRGNPDAGEGFCRSCEAFTGKCGAGRLIVRSDAVLSDWARPCLSVPGELWAITTGAGVTRVLLCPAHAAEVEAGKAPAAGSRVK